MDAEYWSLNSNRCSVLPDQCLHCESGMMLASVCKIHLALNACNNGVSNSNSNKYSDDNMLWFLDSGELQYATLNPKMQKLHTCDKYKRWYIYCVEMLLSSKIKMLVLNHVSSKKTSLLSQLQSCTTISYLIGSISVCSCINCYLIVSYTIR